MAELPIELWHLIFDHLELVDLSSCAQVSKAVYLAVKRYRIREIAFTRRAYEWFHYTTPTIDHKHRIDFMKVSILKRPPFNFDYLKRLKIDRYSSINLNEINKFTRLEELDIDLKSYKKRKKSRTLSLANLKVLYLFMPEHLPYLKLNTPSLAKVYTFDLKKLEFFFPESVRCIHTFFHSEKLSTFLNLEYLTFTDFYNELDYTFLHVLGSFDEFSVTSLEKLKEINFYYDRSMYVNENMDNFKRMAANLLALRRPNLKMFWFHVQMTDSNLLTEYERSMKTVESLLAFQLQHYEMLKEKAHFWSHGFNGSMKKLSIAGFNVRSEEFLSKLLGKFSFRTIDVTGQVEKRELLLKLIARSPELFHLLFKKSGLNQSFFNRMADTIQLKGIPLRQLQFKNTPGQSLDFHFVSKLRHLELFETYQELSTGLITKLFRLPSLVETMGSSGGITKRIERLSTNRFRLNGETLSLQELMKHFPAECEIFYFDSD